MKSMGSMDPVLYPEFLWHTRTCTGTGTLNESIGERTVRQRDRQMLWLYLAAFRCQTTTKELQNN